MTPSATLRCEQAVFTSIRGPMGEGYRIVAASRGLRPEEKQAITRLSPSHEALCWKPAQGNDDASRHAVAFYSLPTGRLCVAVSCYAGAEHTARGGHRVHTHNVVFDEKDFPRCGYNPFHVFRALLTAGLTVPQPPPNSVLSEIQLPIRLDAVPQPPSFAVSLDSPHRRYILQRLFNERTLVVPVEGGWLESTEVLLMGVPGPMRAKLSFGAGLRISLSRCHRLHLLADEKGAARCRVAGQSIEYLDPKKLEADGSASAWITFVDRHWSRDDSVGLARRTSRPFTDLSSAGRERIGVLYNTMDALPLTPSLGLLDLAIAHLHVRSPGVEGEIRKELVAEIQRTLRERLTSIRWHDAQPLWPRLVTFWRQISVDFAQPLIETVLGSLLKKDPLTALEVTLDVAVNVPSAIDRDRHERLIDEVLSCAADRLPSNADPEHLERLCARWQSVTGAHAALRMLMDSCSAAQSTGPASR